MYISTRFSFLLNYAAHYNSKMYLVVTIDVNTMQVFINPQVLENNTQILSNYSFNYTQYVEQPYCSVVKIINSTLQYTYITLSCSHYYYYMSLNFTSGLINIYNKFARYSQCDLYDQFKPSVIMNNGLQMLLAQCRQNDYTFRLQTYETINSSSVVIFTGYLQIFIITGPLGPNCQNDSISPVKIVPLSTSMNNPLFISYSVGANNSKFIYS